VSVFRPTFSPTESQRAIGRNLALDLVGAIGLGVTMALITALLPTIARRGAGGRTVRRELPGRIRGAFRTSLQP
jgi:hypothetical protein